MGGAQAAPHPWCLSVSPAVEPSTHVLPPQSSVLRSPGGRFACSLANYEYSSTGQYAVIGWLQVASCNIMLLRAASLLSFVRGLTRLLSFLQAVT